MSLFGFATSLTLLFASCPPAEAPRLDKAAYERTVKAAYADVQAAFRATRGLAGPALAERIAGGQAALRRAADAITATKPPAEVEADNDALAAGMRRYAAALDTARDAARRQDAGALAAFRDASGQEGVREMKEAAERIKERGYDLGPIADE